MIKSARPPDVLGRDREVADARVFLVDIRYEVLGITHSYLKDGEIYHHKATVVKYTPDGSWLISEMSTASPGQMWSRQTLPAR